MSEKIIIPDEVVISKIYLIRNQKVMLDSDISELYGVETKALNQQIKRNITRFPLDFSLQLTNEEWKNLGSQNVTSSWGGRRSNPYVFTEHDVLMLSSVLKSSKAIAINIQIMRIFIKLREMLLTHKDLLLKLEEMEKNVIGQDEKIELIFKYLKQFVKEKEKPRKSIGFKTKST